MARALLTLVAPVVVARPARVNACWRFEDTHAGRKNLVEEVWRTVELTGLLPFPGSRIVSRWPQGRAGWDNDVGTRSVSILLGYKVVTFRRYDFPPFLWFVLVCFTSELIIVIGYPLERRGRRGRQAFEKDTAGCKTLIVFEVFESHAHEYTLNKIFFDAAEVKKNYVKWKEGIPSSNMCLR